MYPKRVRLYTRDVNTSQFNIYIPNFSKAIIQDRRRPANYYTDQNKLFLRNSYLTFDVLVYPKGYGLKNEGYLSILFSSRITNLCRKNYDISSKFSCIVSIVDNSGEQRFSQSFAHKCEFSAPEPFGLERFVKCSTLLNNADEIILNDKLTIHCYTICDESTCVIPNDICVEICHLPEEYIAKADECYKSITETQTPDGTAYRLKFKGKLFEFLKRESKFFQCVEKLGMLEPLTQSMEIPLEDYQSFLMLETLPSTGEISEFPFRTMEDCYGLYETVDKYAIPRVLKMCSMYLENLLAVDNAVDIFIVANKYSDTSLKAAAMKYIKSFWSEVKSTERWSILKGTRKDLVAEIFQDSDNF